MGVLIRLRRFVTVLRDDISGVILPYVAILLVVFVGLGALALDGGRYMSLQTQMQAVADGLALAGARELNGQPGARNRATNAINNLVSNGLSGLGYSGAITHSAPVFYQALPQANAGYGGTPATSDTDAKFVGVTVNPATIPTIMPINFINNSASNNFSTGARAIAGFTGRAACDLPPVFICNPYETAGMSDNDATAALRTNLSDDPSNDATKRKLIRFDQSQTSPGHFGFLVPPDGCKGASCLRDWIAKTHPNTCYTSPGVDLNTGALTSVYDAFNVRFDLYEGSLNYSPDYAPSVNVRKGYKPGNGGQNKWCSANPASPVYQTLPIINTTGNTQSGNATQRKTITGIPSTDLLKIYSSGGQMIADPGNTKIPVGTTVSSVSSPNLLISNQANNPAQNGISLTINWSTSGLPIDSNMYGNTAVVFGNGDWNCQDYWKINHSVAPPTGCTATNPTLSRYQIYRYEIANNLVDDWSGDRVANTSGNNNGPTAEESGAPYCAGTGNGVDTTTGGRDRRIIFVAVINCLAQQNLITGGNTADNIPVADFAKVFMTQPAGINATSIDSSSIYGEVTGLVSSLDNVRILNQVQLYR